MAYQSRKRNYVSGREKYNKHMRNIRLILIFALVFLVAIVGINWDKIYNYLITYFY